MRLLILCTVYPLFLSAQSAFLRNPDIVWAAEIEQDWVVDIPSLETEQQAGITTLKLLATPRNAVYWSSASLVELVFQAAQRGQLAIFQDAYCQMPVALSSIYPWSNTPPFDPENAPDVDPAYDIKAWRLRQILAYHRKSATWSTTVEAIAPLVLSMDVNRDSSQLQPLFWFRPDNKRQKLNADRIIWAKRTKNLLATARVPTDATRLVKVVDGFQSPPAHLFQVLQTNAATPMYDTTNEKTLSSNQRTWVLVWTDTIIAFDPETYEEMVVAVHSGIHADYIQELQLMQTWAWDDRRHHLSICLDAVAPTLHAWNEELHASYQRPLFYRRPSSKRVRLRPVKDEYPTGQVLHRGDF